MDKLGINLGFLLFQIFNFLILMILLYAFAYKPIVRMLEKRRQKIAQGLEDSRIVAEARANAEKEAEGVIAEARVKAAHIISEATERADAAMLQVKVESEKEIAKEREAALVEIEPERNRTIGL